MADEPHDSLKRELCLTNLTLYIDVHILDSPGEDVCLLKRARDEGWIRLQRTDVMDTELSGKADPVERAQLLDRSSQYAESIGPAIVGHSRIGHCVVGGDEDDERLADVFRILFPNVEPGSARKQHSRDAMHISTAIRYAGSGYVTNERKLLNKSEKIGLS